MSTFKRKNSKAKSLFGILLAVVLLMPACPITAYAAGDNPANSTIEAFPDLRDSLDTMNVNEGKIITLYGGGIIKDNKGTVSSSQGSVYENHGFIESLIAGHVGTNSGTIKSISNTGSLGVNDSNGQVDYLGMGNEISRNDGTITKNAGTVSDNFGTVSENYGTVVMHDGTVSENHGTVIFEAKISDGTTIPAGGTVDNNTGNIEIRNATVTVTRNSGSITVGKNATLICRENKDGGVITKTDESARIDCDEGCIIDDTIARYKIVFDGDDDEAEIIACDLEIGGDHYTYAEGNVIFTLPPEYECIYANRLTSGEWWVSANPKEEDTEFTIVCQKRSPDDPQGHTHDGTLQSGTPATCTAAGVKDHYTCSCGKAFADATCNIEITDLEEWKAEGHNGYIAPNGHNCGEWVIVKEPTLTETGTKERTCSVCKAKETEEIPVLAPAEYSIIYGANSEWAKGSTDGLEFSSNAPFGKFDSVKIDGTTIDASNYTAESGSTRITIFPTYLETLGIGRHSIEIASVDGTASADFSVTVARPTYTEDNAALTDPETGDKSPALPWLVLLLVSSGALAVAVASDKKRKKAE